MYYPNFMYRPVTSASITAIDRWRVCESTGQPQHRRHKLKVLDTPTLRVATWLTPRERRAVDVTANDTLHFLHRDTLAAIGFDLNRDAANAVLISTALIGADTLVELTKLVQGFPGYLIVGLIADADERQAIDGVLLLGQAGVCVTVDIRQAHGWCQLRDILDPQRVPDAFMRMAFAAVLADLSEPNHQNAGILSHAPLSPTTRKTSGLPCFFRAIFSSRIPSVKRLAGQLGMSSSTLTSRFYRAGLPSPRQYLIHARLIWAAHLAESPGRTIGDIADQIGVSSPQGFARSVRMLLRMTAREFRQQFDGLYMLNRFRETLIVPYRERLHGFNPLVGVPVPAIIPNFSGDGWPPPPPEPPTPPKPGAAKACRQGLPDATRRVA